ncbi:hypothetical protein AB7101_18930 [Providencia rettgeri]
MNFILSIIKQLFDDFTIIILLIVSLILANITNNIIEKAGFYHDNLFLFLFLIYFFSGMILKSKKEK